MKRKITKLTYIFFAALIIYGTLFILPRIVYAEGSGPFTITVTAGSNGSISPGTSSNIPKNTDQSYIITADSGYKIDSVIVDGAILTGPFISPFTYTFEKVKENHSILATFAQVPPGTVSVTGVSLDKDKLDLDEGATGQLLATVLPADATNKNVIWQTSDDKIATVDSSGLVTAVKKGDAVITVRTEDGGFTDSCNINVSKKDGGAAGGGTDVQINWAGNGSEYADLSGCENGYWHWILTPGGATPTSGTLYVSYSDNSTSQTSAENEHGSMHFHVYHQGTKVIFAYAIYSYTGTINGNIVLTISDSSCVGGGEEPTKGTLVIHKETDDKISADTVFTFSVGSETVSVIAGAGQPGSSSIELNPGHYTVKENDSENYYKTKVSLNGETYEDGDSIEVTIEAGKTTEVWFFNDPAGEEIKTGTIKLSKEGLTGSAVAVFELREDTIDGKIITPKENEKGEVGVAPGNVLTWDGLDLKKDYYLLEITVPAGYTGSLIPNPLKFVDGDTINITVINTLTGGGGTTTTTITKTTAKPVVTVAGATADTGTIEVLGIEELPFTGTNMLVYLVGFIALLIGGITGGYYINRLLKRKEG